MHIGKLLPGFAAPQREITLSLGDNWRQFTLLVTVNLFVGGMIGMERSVLPGLAEAEFGITSKTAVVSFIATFGLAKVATNLLAGNLTQRFTRRRILISGWLFAIPVPLILIWAPSWGWVIGANVLLGINQGLTPGDGSGAVGDKPRAHPWGWVIGANVLLGINQGLTWSMTVNMKMDLVGPRWRGVALGFNEAAGYLSLAAMAFLTGVIAEAYGLRPEPLYLGIGISATALAFSVLLGRDTAPYLALENASRLSDTIFGRSGRIRTPDHRFWRPAL